MDMMVLRILLSSVLVFSGCAADAGPTSTLALQRAIADLGPSLVEPMDVRFEESGNEAGVVWESLTFDDGHPPGYVRIFWQTLLGDEDMTSYVGEFGIVHEQGTTTVITDDRSSVGVNMRLVRVYDDTKIVSVLASDLNDLEINALRPLAEALFALLP